MSYDKESFVRSLKLFENSKITIPCRHFAFNQENVFETYQNATKTSDPSTLQHLTKSSTSSIIHTPTTKYLRFGKHQK